MTTTRGRRLADWLLQPHVLLDLHIYGGLALLTIGLWQVHWAFGVGAAGAILLGLGLWKSWRG